MFNKANILITGGTGSFGKSFVKTVLERFSPNKVVVYSRDELKQFDMQNEFSHPALRFLLGDVRDCARLTRALIGIDYVVHAAALKQVPALEYNPDEAVKTNIGGAENLIAAACAAKVKKVIALSTDKAVSPVNLYGATKLVADKLFSAANNIHGQNGPKFSIVRYGNVLCSRGSVIPFYQQLLDQGIKKLPITDPQMTRFFVTLPEAVDFVFKSFQRMHGGEIFTPKIPSFKITDLAQAMSGSIDFNHVGIRPGEKLHEVLCPKDLSSRILEFNDFYVVQPVLPPTEDVNYQITAIGEKGHPVNIDFEYNSENNPVCLSIEEIQNLLKNI